MHEQRDYLSPVTEGGARYDRGASAVAPAPASPTISRLIELRERQNSTYELVTQLEEALANSLSPPPPENSKNGAAPSAPSALCQEIDDRIYTQANISSRIASLLQRLTL